MTRATTSAPPTTATHSTIVRVVERLDFAGGSGGRLLPFVAARDVDVLGRAHDCTVPASCRCTAAAIPAAPATAKKAGSSAGLRPMVVTSHRRWPGGRRRRGRPPARPGGAGRRRRRPARPAIGLGRAAPAGTGHHGGGVGGPAEGGDAVVADALVAGPGVGVGVAQAGDRRAAQPGHGVEHRAHLQRPEAQLRSRCPPRPGPWPRWRRRHPARRARHRAEGTLTASRSPPKACPAVTVTSTSAGAPAGAATRSDRASGRAAASVIT